MITGATGFIGSHVAEALCEEGFSCAAFVRDPSRLPVQLLKCCEVRTGDIRDAASVADASRGCSLIIHLAAMAVDWGKEADFKAVNVQGTLNVLEACRRNEIPRAIITGSISSYGEEHSLAIKDETYPLHSHYPYFLDGLIPCAMNRYRDSKAEATVRASAYAGEHGIDCTILEPAWTFGEREFHTGFFTYIQSVRKGSRFMPGSKTNSFHVIYARDLARAFVLAAKKRLPGVERIIIGNACPDSMHRLFQMFCIEAGLPPPRLLSKWIVYPPALLLECAGMLLQRRTVPKLTRGRVNMFYDSIGYSTAKAKRLLGFTCKYSLEEGIRNTVQWYRENGYL